MAFLESIFHVLRNPGGVEPWVCGLTVVMTFVAEYASACGLGV